MCDVIGRSLKGSIGASVVPHTYRPRSVANWTVVFPIGPDYPPRQAPNSCERHNVAYRRPNRKLEGGKTLAVTGKAEIAFQSSKDGPFPTSDF